MPYNPSLGVKRPNAGSYEGKTPAIGDDQAAALLAAPPEDTLKGKRDRAVLSLLLYHGVRRDDLCKLRVGDIETRRGVPHFSVTGKREKTRYIPIHPATLQRIEDYLGAAGHGDDPQGALFRPVKNPSTGELEKPLTSHAVYKDVVKRYALEIGLEPRSISPHGLRATAATNATRAPGRHRESSGVARAREYLNDASL